ncbi:MAG TPA: BlaI/MecI/CopY family transcriptional regulator [Ignavibacteriaceae bacterium]|nr:BlaI/MecI/CopY family transcriptional regulator [Ignavibacteriaceae bacterium]
MKKTKSPKPTEAELEILHILWENGPSTVRFINDVLNKKKAVGYTTTLKIMQIMSEKNLVTRDEENRSHIYSAAYKEDETQKVLLDKFLESAFGGSASKLVMQALGNRKTSKREIEEIREFLDKIEGGVK